LSTFASVARSQFFHTKEVFYSHFVITACNLKLQIGEKVFFFENGKNWQKLSRKRSMDNCSERLTFSST
jgi:hypothetical protein